MWSSGLPDPSTFTSVLQDSWYLPWTWCITHVYPSVACGAVIPQQIVSKTPNTSISIVKYWKWGLNRCGEIPNIAPLEDQIHTATGRNLLRANGMINIHRLIKSSKGYTFQDHLLEFHCTVTVGWKLTFCLLSNFSSSFLPKGAARVVKTETCGRIWTRRVLMWRFQYQLRGNGSVKATWPAPGWQCIDVLTSSFPKDCNF